MPKNRGVRDRGTKVGKMKVWIEAKLEAKRTKKANERLNATMPLHYDESEAKR
jgi:hypothetical protein